MYRCHAHPNNEIIYCARGALYENRVLPSAINNSQEALDSRRLSDSGFPKLFRVHKVGPLPLPPAPPSPLLSTDAPFPQTE